MNREHPFTGPDCRQIEAMLPPFVDGVASGGDAATVKAHLAACPACRQAAAAQLDVRDLLRSRCAVLKGTAPSGLGTQLRLLARGPSERRPVLGWTGRVSALAAAAGLVLAVGAAVVWSTGRSSVLVAAQLTLDHIKCFIIDGDDHDAPLSAAGAEARMQERFGWSVPVPPVPTRADVHLVTVRRCLYGEGTVAHVLYRYAGAPVSMFILPNRVAETADIGAFGRHAQVLVQGGITYVIVAPAGLSNVAAALGLEAK